MEDLLSTQEAAALLGVGPTAVKRWADEGTLPCVRTGGGHRRFRRTDVDQFIAARTPAPVDQLDGWVEALLSEAGSRRAEGLLLLERASAGAWYRVMPLVGRVVEEIGRRWERGALDIVQEHTASDRLARALGRLAEAIPLPPSSPRALLVVVEGDDHTLGLSMADVCLREAGWQTAWAGRATPAEAVVARVARHEVELVAVSASIYSSDPRKLARWLRQVGPPCQAAHTHLCLGGTGAWPTPPPHGTRTPTFQALQTYLTQTPATQR